MGFKPINEEEEKKEKSIRRCSVKVDLDFLLRGLEQVAQPQKDRLEIEEVARVIVTPNSVEIYTYDDKIHIVGFGTIVQRMKWENMNLVEEKT